MKRNYGITAALLALTLANQPLQAGENTFELLPAELRTKEIFSHLIEEPLLDPLGPKHAGRELLEFSLVNKQFQSFFASRLDALKEELEAWYDEALTVALAGKGEPAYLSGRYPALLAIQVRRFLTAKSQRLQRDPRARDKLGYGLLVSVSGYMVLVECSPALVAGSAAGFAARDAAKDAGLAAMSAAGSVAGSAAMCAAGSASGFAVMSAVMSAALSAAKSEFALHGEKDGKTRSRIVYRIAEKEAVLFVLQRALLLPDGRPGVLPLAFDAGVKALDLPAKEESIFRSPEAWSDFSYRYFGEDLPSSAKTNISPFLDALDEIAAGEWDVELSEADEMNE